MKLALFDLDHTLIPFDSGLAWTRHLVARGLLDAAAEERYLAYARQYVAGTLDIHAMVRGNLEPLRPHTVDVLRGWADAYAATLDPLLPASMRALVRQHREAGDLCAIVTATETLIATPYASLFDVPHLVCTEAEVRDGHYTGEIRGLPCFREHKVARVQAWLAGLGDAPRRIEDFPESRFYSDSISDLPLLQAVSHPVAVRPDPRLLAHARAAGWPVVTS